MKILIPLLLCILSGCVGIEVNSGYQREVPTPYMLGNHKNWKTGNRTLLIQHDAHGTTYNLTRDMILQKLGDPHDILYEQNHEIYYYKSGLTYSKGVTIWLFIPLPFKKSGYDREFYIHFKGDNVTKVIENRNENKVYGPMSLLSKFAAGFTY